MERKWAIIIAAVLGLAAVGLTHLYFSQKETQLKLEEARVLVAAKTISKGEVIDYGALKLKVMPTNFIQPGALSSKEQAVGKTAIVTISVNEQIQNNKLAAPGTGLTLAIKTPPNQRAVTIGLGVASAVGGMVRPGDHVDVLAVFSSPSIVVTLFQNVLVLAVGGNMVPEQEGRGRRAKKETSATAAAREAITLSLTPQEVQILTVAMEHGKLRLTLRPRMEKGDSLPRVDLSNLPPAIDLQTLLHFYIRPPEPPPSIEVIRGLEKELTPVPQVY